MKRSRQYICFIICLAIMTMVALTRSHTLFGHDVSAQGESTVETMRTEADGSVVINTTLLGKGVAGYGGNTPVELTVKEGVIVSVRALENNESPDFFSVAIESGILNRWENMSVDDALTLARDVDAVSGATFSSSALIENVRRGLEHAKGESMQRQGGLWHSLSPKPLATAAVIILGAMVPLLKPHRKYRTVQQLLNIFVLGFWGGTFLSYSSILRFLTSGVADLLAVPLLLLIAVAFLYPLFGKKSHYCMWICPLGSCQEVIGRCFGYKFKITPLLNKRLTLLREILWMTLMLLMLAGLYFDWMNYELFAAFMFREASPVILLFALAFLLLSAVVMRPYCRFVCPTGTLMKMAEEDK